MLFNITIIIISASTGAGRACPKAGEGLKRRRTTVASARPKRSTGCCNQSYPYSRDLIWYRRFLNLLDYEWYPLPFIGSSVRVFMLPYCFDTGLVVDPPRRLRDSTPRPVRARWRVQASDLSGFR